ncbi:haloacid dehalogenase-like hydrolase [Methylobacterium sp. ap11]|nr:haloacid dehalogenase-like hydrolase [Methylobacterium sp. ap11]
MTRSRAPAGAVRAVPAGSATALQARSSRCRFPAWSPGSSPTPSGRPAPPPWPGASPPWRSSPSSSSRWRRAWRAGMSGSTSWPCCRWPVRSPCRRHGAAGGPLRPRLPPRHASPRRQRLGRRGRPAAGPVRAGGRDTLPADPGGARRPGPGLPRAARHGIVVKGGGALETLAKVAVLVVDKTGTLTQGRARLTAVAAFPPFGEAEVLRLAASLDQASAHPVARALVDEARARGLSRLALAGQRFARLGSCFGADFRRRTGNYFGEIYVALASPSDVTEMPGDGVIGFVEGGARARADRAACACRRSHFRPRGPVRTGRAPRCGCAWRSTAGRDPVLRRPAAPRRRRHPRCVAGLRHRADRARDGGPPRRRAGAHRRPADRRGRGRPRPGGQDTDRPRGTAARAGDDGRRRDQRRPGPGGRGSRRGARGARGAAAGGDPHRAAGPRHRAPERARRARALARRHGRCGLRRAHAGAERPAAGGHRRRRDPERDAGPLGPRSPLADQTGRAGADSCPERPPARRAGIREPRGGRCRVAGRRAGQCARNSGTGASIRSERVTPPKTNSRTRECR